MREVAFGPVLHDGRRAVFWLINGRHKHVGWLMPGLEWKSNNEKNRQN